ncbi:hypothetical protein B0H66DRAFT_568374, partial [Apodospora peruviana]
MAEALAALGVAANVLQFVECGLRVMKTAHQLKSSTDGATATELEDLTRDLSTSMHTLKASPVSHMSLDLSKSISTCADLSDELASMLSSLKLDPKDSTPWKRLKVSVQTHRKAGEIGQLDARLTKLRSQIMDSLNFNLLSELVAQEASENSFRADTLSGIQKLADKVAALAETRPWETSDPSDPGPRPLENTGDKTFRVFLSQLVDGLTILRQEKRVNRVLKSLHFRQIAERVSEVSSAHQNTFSWIFGDNPKANVAEWMESHENNEIYWVSGNAGSGKSTLMKYLMKHPSSIAALDEWTDNGKIQICSHFFWSAGTAIQKSQEGLLRALLFQIMLHKTYLIKELCPERWKEDSFAHMEPWTRRELEDTFYKLAYLPDDPFDFRICIFIDGLDEYRGDHRELLSFLFDLAKSPKLKICVSSRPWIEFRQAFEKSQWKLAVHDLTSDDVQKYVKDKLSPQKPAYPWLETHDAAVVDPLAEEICRKAQGVFLWVFLVVRSLIKGLANGDEFRDLQRRVGELPSDLEEYFRLMLDNIDSVYRRRTARVFKSLVHTDASLPILLFHFINLEEEDPDYALKDSLKPLSESQVLAIVKPKRYQVIAQCKDLIKLTCFDHEPVVLRDRVTFLHRTVSDFLRTESMDNLLQERAGQEFEPRLTLSRAWLAMIKTISPASIQNKTLKMDRLRRFVLAIIAYAQELEALDMDSQIHAILDALDMALKPLLDPTSDSGKSNWEDCFLGIRNKTILGVMARIAHFHYFEHAVPFLEAPERVLLLSEVDWAPRMAIASGEGFMLQLVFEEYVDSQTVALLKKLCEDPSSSHRAQAVAGQSAGTAPTLKTVRRKRKM